MSDHAAKDDVWVNVVLCAAISVVEAVQVLIIVALVFSFIPIPPTDFVSKLFPISLYDVRPEREMMLYRLWILMAIAIQAGLVVVFRKRLNDHALRRQLLLFLGMSMFWVFVSLVAVFKIIIWGNPSWARGVLYAALLGAVLSKIFWPELKQWIERFHQWLSQGTPLRWPWELGFLTGFMVLLWPIPHQVLARVFVNDEFYHTDGFFMSAAWAHLKGLALNQDVISQYGIALPIIFAEVLKRLGGFDYPSAVILVVIVTLVYYLALYAFLRSWLKSRGLAAFGVVLTAKLQLFHWGVAPLVWQFPSATPLRHWPDLVFFFCLWRHTQAMDQRWLTAAAAVCGFGLVWMIDVGTYMTGALLVYVFLAEFQGRFDRISMVRSLGTVIRTIVLGAIIVLALLQPSSIFNAQFWKNGFEFAGLFLQGWGALPMTEGLKDKQFFAFVMGFVIPIVYGVSLIYTVSACFLKKMDFKNILVAVISVYGLGMYHYFIHRSGVTSYYAVCVPLVLVLCFWIKECTQNIDGYWRRMTYLGVVVAALGALMSGYFFTYYPNLLNLSKMDWKQEIGFFQKEFDFSKDAEMIRQLTGPHERVALISSFETKILMQANRAPFFYYAQMVESSHMNTPQVRGVLLHTHDRLAKTIAQLENEKPPYVFIEKKLLVSPTGALKALIDDISKQYSFSMGGQYLAAFKRGGS